MGSDLRAERSRACRTEGAYQSGRVLDRAGRYARYVRSLTGVVRGRGRSDDGCSGRCSRTASRRPPSGRERTRLFAVVRPRPSCRLYHEALDPSIVHGIDPKEIPVFFYLVAHFGYSAQTSENESTDRFDVLTLELGIEPVVHFPDRHTAVDDVRPVTSGLDGGVLRRRVELVSDVADGLLEDVLDGYDPFEDALLVDHDRDLSTPMVRNSARISSICPVSGTTSTSRARSRAVIEPSRSVRDDEEESEEQPSSRYQVYPCSLFAALGTRREYVFGQGIRPDGCRDARTLRVRPGVLSLPERLGEAAGRHSLPLACRYGSTNRDSASRLGASRPAR